MPRIVWDNNQLQIQYYSSDDLTKFVETAIAVPARQFGLLIEVRKDDSENGSNKKKMRIQTVRL